ncbi:CoA-disulfide reductase [Serpentinicella sp. ANB-PHB4]|uniref:CoA-disulfide reductase n=1 Tax=Serpentinicella sp. ANB-PHB4 TaxID=3074076 RepID=UPI002861E45E|nr:CoA-disulfide reductase [Serpentinicella sp. ANB-PHB4]MDR5658454.1 CoA-disulfide reductase [Serpentinicella sp. ANB-PHB4]
MNNKKRVLIVGGVAGGASAAARLRRLDENIEIILFERGEYISFANCGLPYYIGEVIQQRDALLVQTPEGMSSKFNIDIRVLNEVTEIHPKEQKIQVRDLKKNSLYEESYDYLILSPGANPILPPIPGIKDAKNLFTLRTIPDTDQIKAFVDEQQPKSAVVIGGGFIGIEMAENLVHRGVNVTIVEMAEQVMGPIDYEMASILHNHIEDKKVDLILKDGVKSFENAGKEIILESGKQLNPDLIIFSIGVRPELQLAKSANLKIGDRGGIVVDEYLQTSEKNIYALGDAIEVTDFITGNQTILPLAGPANKQGRIVSNNIVGTKEKYLGTMGSAVAKVFDMTVASTGKNEKSLKQLDIPYDVIHIHPGSHAGYYPGAFPISLKVLFNRKTEKIYGAQAVGYDGVEKRMDVIATAISAGLKVTQLKDLELTYAPPYSSAKDPVNMIGFIAENMIHDHVQTFQWHEVNDLVENGALLLDVREEIELDLGHIEKAINIPLHQLRDRLNELPKDEIIYVFCQVGLRGYLAARILSQAGFKVKNLDGGYKTYQTVFRPNITANCPIQIEDDGVAKKECRSEKDEINEAVTSHVQINACGLQCPGPIMQVYQAINNMKEGEILEVSATDPGFSKDINAWCQKTGNTLLKSDFDDNAFKCFIQKGTPKKSLKGNQEKDQSIVVHEDKENATIVVFSGDLDKALASFIIASGAATMGKKVTLFFTFWGLNVLRKHTSPKVRKSFIEKMFGRMMPRGTKKLPISKMNMAGMGPRMIQYVMSQKNVDSLDVLMKNAMDVGVNLVACAMSMDIMGIKEEELIDGVEVGGVATYLGEAEDSNLNLFI